MMHLSYQGWGGDAYPGETPQYMNDHRQLQEPWVHDDPEGEPHNGEYKFFLANGQVHVSPHHDYDELREHTGVEPDSNGPMAIGRVSVNGGRATWSVRSTVSLNNVAQALKRYGQQVGWEWGGLTSLEGNPVDDSFAPHASFYFTEKDGHVYLGEQPKYLAKYGKAHRIVLAGRTAYVERFRITAGLKDWANDSGFKLAEYPGGSDMLDQLYNSEDLETFNLGESAQTPLPSEKSVAGGWKCRDCGQVFPHFDAYMSHRGDHMQKDLPQEDGKFPELDMDASLPPHYHERKPFLDVLSYTTMPVASWREAAKVSGFNDYAPWYGYDSDEGYRHYVAYRNGSAVGYATVKLPDELVMVQSAFPGRKVATALVRTVQSHFPRLRTGSVSDAGRGLLSRLGFVEVSNQMWKWSVGQDPKDMLEAAVPFVYDVDKDTINFGQPGQKTSDIQGEFTPGGIVEGEYHPGGKVLLTSDTTMPYTVRHFTDLWKHSPISGHMEITSVERQVGNQTMKLAATDVGNYLRTLSMADPAVWQAFHGLAPEGQVYVVGGAVRDALLQKQPKDFDLLVTGVSPDKVEHILDKLPGKLVKKKDAEGNEVTTTGKDFGVFRYKYKGGEVEVALPRTEKSTGARRRDFDVSVDHNLPIESDLLRRDFTVNAMAVNLSNGKLIDPYGGAKDIKNNTLRTVHPSSFEEDPTRIVRGMVAHAKHGFIPDERTRQEMIANAGNLAHETPERIREELDKLFSTDNPARGIRLGQETGALHHIFPELARHWDADQNNPHHSFTLGEHSLNVLDNISRETTDPVLRLSALLHDVGKKEPHPDTGEYSEWINHETGYSHYYRGRAGQGADHALVGAAINAKRLRALKYPSAVIKRVEHVTTHHMFPAFDGPKGARKFIQRVGDEHANDLLTLRFADQYGKGQSPSEIATRTSVDKQRGLVEQVRSAQEPTQMSGLAINGKDLIQMGVPQGPMVGKVLRHLLDEVVADPQLNERNALMQMATEYAAALPT